VVRAASGLRFTDPDGKVQRSEASVKTENGRKEQ
jgi:hypothetical protein